MKFSHFILPVLLVLFCSPAFAQGTISGKIIDAETKQPLEGASVFAQNTTRGTVTDREGNFSLYLNKGGYEINISFTGYESRKINYEATGDRNFTLEMEKAEASLSEVVIRSSNEVENGWEKHGQFFLDHFLGTTPFAAESRLLNPEVLKFFYYKRNERLKVMATEPLQVRNDALGYAIRYELDSFVHYMKSDINTYRGLCLFTELEGTEEEKLKWKNNRKEAYLGSRLHFIRSYYDSTLAREGFTVDLLSRTRTNKFDRLSNPYDTSYFYIEPETGEAELWFPTKASITYNKKAPEKEYLKHFRLPADVKVQISYVDLLENILIRENGFFTEQKNWINQGYWSWKNLADQLPYDYELE